MSDTYSIDPCEEAFVPAQAPDVDALIKEERVTAALLRRAQKHPAVLEIMADCASAIDTENAATWDSADEQYDGSKWTNAAAELRQRAAAIRAEDPEIWEDARPAPAAQELTDAARDVLAERLRQVRVEGYTPEHDDGYTNGLLSMAAVAYLDWVHGEYEPGAVPGNWPFAYESFKSCDLRRSLVKAAALLLAEIERLDRAAKKEGGAV